MAWEGGGAPPLARVLREGAADSLIVGPEGGFTAEEFQWALEQGVRPVDLGPNILRVETAALAGAAVILALAP
ncbi:MAG: Ribosomal RNA small subunit methyltransferase E [candidate division BRC1 bacterium ADurb.BinA364]|nr:MAG: Ribosomal RNA small subunit methyltransferase E [candidate division BRC1 bacterium ADurb.BinA364]